MSRQLGFFVENNYFCIGRDRKNGISDCEADYATTHNGKIT
jgi:hypothetical protein